jgi:catechol 2,3-dioxygenase-like lactoylglutathione lyase family enzyme
MLDLAQRFALLALFLLVLPSITFSQSTPSSPERPRITGFSHVAVYVEDLDQAARFYGEVLGYAKESPTLFDVNEHQSLELEKGPQGTQNRIAHIAFLTDSAEGLRRYLQAQGVKVPDAVSDGRNGNHWFAMVDPAGQPIEFIDEKPRPPAAATKTKALRPASDQIIHVGFLVRDRAPEEHFYKDILGFRPYWHGGMVPDRTDWVALQVPDGTVWIEEMLGASAHPDLHELGVLNHFSLGVEKIDSVIPNLKQHGWSPVGNDQKATQLGKDGKWQFNIYDPDLTRVEYMEFRPAQKPCCSDFTGPHPHE